MASFQASAAIKTRPVALEPITQHCTIYNYGGITMDVSAYYPTSPTRLYNLERIRNPSWSLAAFSDECVRRAEQVCVLPVPRAGKSERVAEVIISARTIGESPYPRLAPGDINVLSGINGMVVSCTGNVAGDINPVTELTPQ